MTCVLWWFTHLWLICFELVFVWETDTKDCRAKQVAGKKSKDQARVIPSKGSSLLLAPKPICWNSVSSSLQ